MGEIFSTKLHKKRPLDYSAHVLMRSMRIGEENKEMSCFSFNCIITGWGKDKTFKHYLTVADKYLVFCPVCDRTLKYSELDRLNYPFFGL